jgi:hypothetical protein
MSTNESDIFEENDLYINGTLFQQTTQNTINQFNKFSQDLYSTLTTTEINELHDQLK